MTGGTHPRSCRELLETCEVGLVYEADGESTTFSRSVSATDDHSKSEFKINGTTVSQTKYLATLEKENILVKARNFLVFQGDVEMVASQSPRDLTLLIEQISGYLYLLTQLPRTQTPIRPPQIATRENF